MISELKIYFTKKRNYLFRNAFLSTYFKFDVLFFLAPILFIFFGIFFSIILVELLTIGHCSIELLIFSILSFHLSIFMFIFIIIVIKKTYDNLKTLNDNNSCCNFFLAKNDNLISIVDSETNNNICLFHLRDIKRAKKFRKIIIIDIKNNEHNGLVILPNLKSIRNIFSEFLDGK